MKTCGAETDSNALVIVRAVSGKHQWKCRAHRPIHYVPPNNNGSNAEITPKNRIPACGTGFSRTSRLGIRPLAGPLEHPRVGTKATSARRCDRVVAHCRWSRLPTSWTPARVRALQVYHRATSPWLSEYLMATGATSFFSSNRIQPWAHSPPLKTWPPVG